MLIFLKIKILLFFFFFFRFNEIKTRDSSERAVQR